MKKPSKTNIRADKAVLRRKSAQPVKKLSPSSFDFPNGLFRPVDLKLLEIVEQRTKISAKQVLRLSLAAALVAWFNYDDETRELEITADWPDEPSILRAVEAAYLLCLKQPRPDEIED
jgi:hypothetical protein